MKDLLYSVLNFVTQLLNLQFPDFLTGLAGRRTKLLALLIVFLAFNEIFFFMPTWLQRFAMYTCAGLAIYFLRQSISNLHDKVDEINNKLSRT